MKTKDNFLSTFLMILAVKQKAYKNE